MSDEKYLQLLEFPQEEDMIEARIWALHDLMLDTDRDYIPRVLEMLVSYIGDSYEGYCIDQCLTKISEGKLWWDAGSEDQ